MIHDALGLLETTGLTPALAAVDVMDKTAGVRVVQAELNDLLGVCIKIAGSPDQVTAALDAGYSLARQLGGRPIRGRIDRVDPRAWPAIASPPEYNPLIQQDVVFFPSYQPVTGPFADEEPTVAEPASFALGFLETQGFTAAFEAIDSACKAANVEVVGKEKLGGGYVTIIIKGDVSAVNAAIEAGKTKVDALGTLIAAHVIARPSPSTLGLLPKS